MSTEPSTNGIPPDVLADARSILDRFARGEPVDRDAARRVQEYSRTVSEETCRKFGEVDVDALLHAARDE